MTAIVGAVLALACLWFPIAFCLGIARAGGKGGVPDRCGVVDGLAAALIGVLLSWLLLPWGTLPALLWAVPVGVTVYGALLAARRWPELPGTAGSRRALRLAGTALGVAVVGLLAIVLVP